jgi:predicted GNAT family acetyltransferase
MTDAEVIDDMDQHKFVIHSDDGDAALFYSDADHMLTLTHAEVPDSHRGEGWGERLVRAAVHRAARTGEMIVPKCDFAQEWLHDHPESTDGVRIGWSKV